MMQPAEPVPSPAAAPPSQRERASRLISSLVGVGLSVLFIWLAFRNTDLAGLLARLERLALVPVGVCILIQIACQVVRVGRWGVMMRRLGEITWRDVSGIGAVGLAAVAFFPVRLGELARPALVAEETHIDFGETVATVVAERLIDGLLMSAVLFVSLFALGSQRASPALVAGGTVFALVFLAALAVLVLGQRIQGGLSRLIRASFGRLSERLTEALVRQFEGFMQALRLVSTREVLGPYLGLSIALWALEALTLVILFAILPSPLPLVASLVVLSALVVGAALPSGPAHLGVFEFAAVVGLQLFAVDANSAAFYGSLLHLMQILILLGFGLFGLWLGRFHFDRVLRLGRGGGSPPSADGG
jgi:uncharacterized protein (TIRG00374 family)